MFELNVRVRRWQLAEGQALMDEGMTWAVGGELAPLPSALIFCRTIGTCYELGDYGRATESMEPGRRCERSGQRVRALTRWAPASTRRGRRPSRPSSMRRCRPVERVSAPSAAHRPGRRVWFHNGGALQRLGEAAHSSRERCGTSLRRCRTSSTAPAEPIETTTPSAR